MPNGTRHRQAFHAIKEQIPAGRSKLRPVPQSLRRMMKHLRSVQHILPEVFQARQWQRQWQVQRLYGQWAGIAGSEASRSSVPVAIRGQVLWLYVSNAIWAQEIHYRQNELLSRIDAAVPGLGLRALRCQVETSFFETNIHARGSHTPRKQRPDTDRPHHSGFDAIGDPACREALRRLWRIL